MERADGRDAGPWRSPGADPVAAPGWPKGAGIPSIGTFTLGGAELFDVCGAGTLLRARTADEKRAGRSGQEKVRGTRH
ncbi:hypothetical protein GCM10009799_11170 [Nocardiopsis rhodophaea]|uniref:Uncharacterized protein n=1 Tax=Nocardiopsis rhodophaea TaxID=280238 RepID=A0ABN2SIN4_9ACTN